MTSRRGARRLIAFAFAFAFAGASGCSLLVSSDVAEFQCVDATSACPSGLRCDAASRRCVSADSGGPLPTDGSSEGPTTDAQEAGKDAPSSPFDLGSQCRLDLECKSGLCASSTILTTTITQSTGPICTSPCCTSAECPSTFVCFNGGTSGGYCIPSTLAQRTLPGAGSKGGGLSCTTNAECRSGLCTGSPKACLDTCCVATDCGGSTTCRLNVTSAPGPAHDVWVCAAPRATGVRLPGDSCTDSVQCVSDSCIGFSAGQICRPPCSNSASCKSVAGFTNGHCSYGSSGNDFFKFCYATTTGSRSNAGVACTDDTSCKSDYCDPELKACANVCGKDADCLPNETCRPSGVNTPYLRCVLRP